MNEADTNYDDAADMAIIEHLSKIGDAQNLYSRWCIEGINNMEDLAKPHSFQNAHMLAYDTNAFFGGAGGRFKTAINGPCWIDLWKAADRVILYSQDKHHVFIESFSPTDEPGVIRLTAGS